MKCQNCSSKNKDGEVFCFLCGAKLEKEEPAPEKENIAKNDIKTPETADSLGGSELISKEAVPVNFAQSEKNIKNEQSESEPKHRRLITGIILGIILGVAAISTLLIILIVITGGNGDVTNTNGGGGNDDEKPQYTYPYSGAGVEHAYPYGACANDGITESYIYNCCFRQYNGGKKGDLIL